MIHLSQQELLLFLGASAFRHVLNDRDKILRLSLDVSRQGNIAANPDLRSIGTQISFLKNNRNTVAGELSKASDAFFAVVRMRHVGDAEHKELVLRARGDLAIAAVDVEKSTVETALNDAN